jgi:cytidine deaminase
MSQGDGLPAVDWDELLRIAREARKAAHAPYSDYQVGAALLTRTGRIYRGCNVENATFGLTICAERAAVVQMVAGGDQDPVAIVVVTPGPPVGMPCGMCRQTLAEFADDLPVHIAPPEGDDPAVKTTLGELLPLAFRPQALADVRKP